MLHGRGKEQAELDRLLDRARAGASGALLMSGEPGIGKSALVDYAAGQAPPLTVLRVSGVASEAELPYAALQLLLSPILDEIEALPEPQSDALRAALGLAAAPPSGVDRFLVGLAALTLLAERAPLVCLVDDAQWLDRASADALRFVARRLRGEGVALVFAARPGFEAPGVPVLCPADLDRAAAARLLDEHAPALSAAARERVLAEAAGNPLALRELPAHTTDPLATARLPLPHRIQQAYEQRIRDLPEPTQTLLALAAAEETGDLTVIFSAAAALGLPVAALDAADAAGLVTVSGPVWSFRHPLIRAAAYQNAAYSRRLELHRALAAVLTGEPDADLRAWHLAAAATGPDAEVAAALERAADRARERTGFSAAASALARSAQLTPEPAERGRRLVLAAETAELAGRTEHALALADEAERLTPELRPAALRARIAFESGSLRAACDILIDAAAEHDTHTAAAMLNDAVRAAFYAGEPGWAEQARAKLDRLPLPADDPARLMAAGVTLMLAGAVEDGVSHCRAYVARAGRTPDAPAMMRSNAASMAILVGDFEAARTLSASLTGECRTRGMIGWMPLALATLSVAELYHGRFRDSALAAGEGLRVAEDTGQIHRLAHQQGVLAWLAAVAGEEDRCRALAEQNLTHFATEHVATSRAWGVWALAMLDLGHGRFEAALDRLDRAAHGPLGRQIHAVYFAPDQVEAAIRLGRPDAAAEPYERFRRWAEAAGQGWARAVLHRCQALLAPDPDAEEHYLAALDGAGRPFEQARTELLYGEWLRRTRRRTDARTHLRAARETFHAIGAGQWAERAVAELRATGETLSRHDTDDLAGRLTAQELQVVRLASTGATNKQIAAQLFLSPKTVSHHLYRAFPKLGVTVRTELAHIDLG
ncbi:AAA family ATPase [Nonomuraea sp. NN258]|uniref:ATP-binding protein n=1 Tax=Nonomuraea antri TaxID=2730852 RepID=UPI001569C647|nr:helix-turn-helix transcriptional regulator [Nonomuraea antri]NRQ33386.1 AAA family ATPase [Nonomuraea antri]